jgi:hypothetical protein
VCCARQLIPAQHAHTTHEILDVVVAQALLGVDDAVQVRFHQVRDDVDVLEVVQRRRLEDVLERDHVLVRKVPQQLDLAEDALGVDQIVERARHLLDRHLFTGLVVVGGPVAEYGHTRTSNEVRQAQPSTRRYRQLLSTKLTPLRRTRRARSA